MLPSELILKTIHEFLPEDLKKLVTAQVHQICFTWARLPRLAIGSSSSALTASKEAQKRINFLEFLIYLCVLGKEINKLEVVTGSQEKTPTDVILSVLSHLLPHYSHELHQVPENDTRGLAEFAQDILLQGSVQKYEG